MSSIPLVALAAQQPPSFADQYGKALQLSQLVNQQKLSPGQLQEQQQDIQTKANQNQITQLQLNDQQAMTKAMRAWDGQDVNDLPGLILKNGGSANAVFSTKNQLLDYSTKLQALNKDQLANEGTKADVIAGHIDTVTNLPPDQQPAAFDSAKRDLVQRGYMTPQQAQSLTYQGPDQLDSLEKMYMAHSQQVDQQAKSAV